MNYTDTAGNEFELPKYTAALRERFTAASNGAGDLRKQYELVREMLPVDYVDERLDGTTYADIDVSQLQLLFSELHNGYELPAITAQLQQAADVLAQAAPMIEMLDKMANSATLTDSRKGFKRVK